MRIIRLCMMLVLVMVSIPMANAVEIDSPKATSNIVYLQRDTGVEAIQLPENVTQADKARMQKNLLLYGNRVHSESEVAKINQEAAAKGGLVYGPWFGGVEKYYSMSTAESMSALAWVANAVVPILSAAGAISLGAAAVAEALCLGCRNSFNQSAGIWHRIGNKRYYEEAVSGGFLFRRYICLLRNGVFRSGFDDGRNLLRFSGGNFFRGALLSAFYRKADRVFSRLPAFDYVFWVEHAFWRDILFAIRKRCGKGFGGMAGCYDCESRLLQSSKASGESEQRDCKNRFARCTCGVRALCRFLGAA